MTWSADEVTERLAADVEDGWTINLGVGMPTTVTTKLRGRPVLVHSENGILGMGGPPPEGEGDPDLLHAGKGYASIVPGGATFDSAISFGLVRSGRLDLSVMGAYQVAVNGDLANWRLPGRRIAGIGGAADLAAGAKRVWVIMNYRTKDGAPRVVPELSYPVTALGCVSRVYCECGVFVNADGRLQLVEVAPGVDAAALAAESGCELGAWLEPQGTVAR